MAIKLRVGKHQLKSNLITFILSVTSDFCQPSIEKNVDDSILAESLIPSKTKKLSYFIPANAVKLAYFQQKRFENVEFTEELSQTEFQVAMKYLKSCVDEKTDFIMIID